MSKPPSLLNVARTAGLSPATVSRYLNGSLSLPKETADRIDAAIASLNYRPNPHARSLSRGRSDTIGLVIPDIANPFFAKLAAAVEYHAEQAELGLMLYSSVNRQERELDCIERLRRSYVDGLLFITNHQDADGALARAINASSNLVVLDEDVVGTDVPKVFSDNLQGAGLAARALLDAGHRHAAYIGGPRDIMSSRERVKGFVDMMAAGGASVEAQLFGDYTMAYGRAAIAELLDRYPDVTAVFAASDEIMYGMAQAMKARGLRLGHNLSVITYDDVGPLDLLDPPVTAIRQSIDDIGRIGFELLRKRMSGDMSAPEIRVPTELVERGSVRRLDR